MNTTPTNLAGCFVITPTVFSDERGSFFESFNQQGFLEKTGIDVCFVQDNQSISQRGTLRGLHFQKEGFSQAKLVRVIQGKVLDVVVDIRPSSKTYGQHFSMVLTGENNQQIFIPKGFAHGFSVLEDNTIFSYKCDTYYHPSSEGGIRYDDPILAIDWMVNPAEILLSEKDKNLPNFKK